MVSPDPDFWNIKAVQDLRLNLIGILSEMLWGNCAFSEDSLKNWRAFKLEKYFNSLACGIVLELELFSELERYFELLRI